MDLLLISFESVAALIGIGLLGFFIIARRILPLQVMDVLPALVIDVAAPCLVFTNIIQRFDPSIQQNWWSLPLYWIAFTVVTFSFTMIVRFSVKKDHRGEFSAALFYQNGLFIPLALISGMFGMKTPYLVDLFLFAIFYPAFFFNTYHLFFHGRTPSQTPNLKIIGNPILLATICAVVFKLTGFSHYIPSFIVSSFELVGKMAIPLIFIIVGGTIYIDFHKRGKWQIREMIKFVFYKNFILPLLILGILVLVRPDYNVALIIAIVGATPPISAVPLMVERVGGNRELVNQLLVASYISAVVSIPLIVWLFGNFFTR